MTCAFFPLCRKAWTLPPRSGRRACSRPGRRRLRRRPLPEAGFQGWSRRRSERRRFQVEPRGALRRAWSRAPQVEPTTRGASGAPGRAIWTSPRRVWWERRRPRRPGWPVWSRSRNAPRSTTSPGFCLAEIRPSRYLQRLPPRLRSHPLPRQQYRRGGVGLSPRRRIRFQWQRTPRAGSCPLSRGLRALSPLPLQPFPQSLGPFPLRLQPPLRGPRPRHRLLQSPLRGPRPHHRLLPSPLQSPRHSPLLLPPLL